MEGFKIKIIYLGINFKIKNMKTKILLIALTAILFTGCRVADFTIISSKTVTINVKKDAPRVKGWGWTVKDAVDNAIEKPGGGYDALIDGVISQRLFGYSVKGTPIKLSEK